jgi:hypothetical protein
VCPGGCLGTRKPSLIFDHSDPKHLGALRRELKRIYDRNIPEEYRDERVLGWGWFNFLAACVFYDPPETQLLQFADDDDPPSDPAPIRLLPEVPHELVYAEKLLWIETIDAIEPHHVEALSAGGSNLIAEIWKRNPHLEKEHRAAREKVQYRHYIEVNEDTTGADVHRAYRAIVEARKEQLKERSKGGAPPLEPLLCIQCAILYDRHKGIDPQDRRRKEWT